MDALHANMDILFSGLGVSFLNKAISLIVRYGILENLVTYIFVYLTHYMLERIFFFS